MWLTGNLPIQRKVTLVVLVTCVACLMVACTALFVFQLRSSRDDFVRNLTALSEIVADVVAEGVTLNDASGTTDILKGLKTRQNIVGVTITRRGEPFASFEKAEDPAALAKYENKTDRVFEGNSLLAFRPIMFDDEQVGMLYVRADYGKVYWRLVGVFGATVALVLLVSVGLAWIISSRLQRFVSEPILRLADTAKSIAKNKDYSVRANATSSNDEVGLFTEAFNQMLTQIEAQDSQLQSAQEDLENQVTALQREISERQRAEHRLADAHRQLVETSRQAGMAEVATGVLHNVGNVLNSVNVSATLVSDRVRQSKADNLLKASTLLREHAEHLEEFFAHDPRAKLLLEYLPNLGTHLNEERAEMLNELELLTKNLDHIKDIVAMQQSYARVAGVVEPVSLAGLAEDALQMNAAALVRHSVHVVRNYSDVPPVAVDKHKVLQILVNLVRNAKYAMDEHAQEHKELEIFIRPEDEDRVRIAVKDNGTGISPENLVKIFSHGFTTKADGHGFGLHSSAIVARELGGSLWAESDGLGTGATFTLELPVAVKVNA
jgi:signal transduction histidine kinase